MAWFDNIYMTDSCAADKCGDGSTHPRSYTDWTDAGYTGHKIHTHQRHRLNSCMRTHTANALTGLAKLLASMWVPASF